ncbi:MAG: lgt, phosphatidylglycerol:prolipoprotein diacylglycerol transferase [Chloroflexi bacterium]|nr:lgt, phosphatidylglycerol:prolipoprotein diacylglycerol transferase [Chloroflexota bacterium]
MPPVNTATIKYGPISIHWFGIIVALALIAGLLVSLVMARLRAKRPDPLVGILMLGLLAGLIGARIWYYVFRRDWYNPDPGRVFAVWQGGMALHGALLGAMLATLIYTWYKRLNFWTWADICAPGLILGQAIGRIGDLLNNQAFGPPTSGPFAVIIPRENRPPQFLAFSHFTPLAAYEAIWDLAIFAALIGLTLLQRWRPRVLPVGAIFLLYLILYSVGRIPLEGLRVDSLWVHNMRVAQLASFVMIGAGVLLYAIRLVPRREPAPFVAQAPQTQLTDAYLAAAARSSQLKPLELGPDSWDSVDKEPAETHNGNGYNQTTALPPVENATLELPASQPSAQPPSKETP